MSSRARVSCEKEAPWCSGFRASGETAKFGCWGLGMLPRLLKSLWFRSPTSFLFGCSNQTSQKEWHLSAHLFLKSRCDELRKASERCTFGRAMSLGVARGLKMLFWLGNQQVSQMKIYKFFNPMTLLRVKNLSPKPYTSLPSGPAQWFFEIQLTVVLTPGWLEHQEPHLTIALAKNLARFSRRETLFFAVRGGNIPWVVFF